MLPPLDFLLSAPAQAALLQLAADSITPQNHLTMATMLRQRFAPAEAQAILEQATLRQKASAKFSRAQAMFFSRAALEQASGELISRHRAARYANIDGPLADLGCGIGGDALALAQVGPLLGIDLDPARLQLARHNVAVYGGPAFQPVQADLRHFVLPKLGAFFCDPARRDGQGRRLFDPAAFRPPLSLVSAWRQKVGHAGIKLGPGLDISSVPDLEAAELEFIAVGIELKEAVAWYGDLRSPARRRATILPAGVTLTESDGDPTSQNRPVARYLYEPNPAILRAGLVTQLGSRLEAGQIDSQIAYLTADHVQETPFARCFEINDTIPFQLKRLRTYLRARRIGRVTIKKRGSPLDVAQLERQLRLNGPNEQTLFLTRAAGQPVVLIGQPLVAK